MKKLFMPLFLLSLSNPVLANQYSNPSECLQMYRNQLNDQNINRSQMMEFVDRCMPSRQALDEPVHRKLLQVIYGEKKIITVRT
ncbi:MAG: hypothetical protein KJN89_05075 [Gammaproteobacteria bacterium]|nr:hypothetical protein [Gammaproteobacteria bacterium]MBT8133797.1 hypothetical protein [Gammaproteobacteria bacterium]NNJ49724.1 hypothetical protein [Gammaproteobacteria bacterium]